MQACFSLWLVVFACCGAAWAQGVSTSQIKGTVQDPSGAAVPGAEIKVVQTDTGALRTAVTETDCPNVLPSLPI